MGIFPRAVNASSTGNKQAVIDAIKSVEQVIGPNDKFVFYGMTHGSYDNNNDEESWMSQNNPNDLNSRKLSNGDEYLALGQSSNIYDDELHDLFNTSRWDDVQKLFILEACFSGGFWGTTTKGDSGDLATLPKTGLLSGASEGNYALAISTPIPEGNDIAVGELGVALVDILHENSKSNELIDLKELTLRSEKLATQERGERIAQYGPSDYRRFGFVLGEQDWGAPIDLALIDHAEFSSFQSDDFDMKLGTNVPEPSTLISMGLGFSLLFGVTLRRFKFAK